MKRNDWIAWFVNMFKNEKVEILHQEDGLYFIARSKSTLAPMVTMFLDHKKLDEPETYEATLPEYKLKNAELKKAELILKDSIPTPANPAVNPGLCYQHGQRSIDKMLEHRYRSYQQHQDCGDETQIKKAPAILKDMEAIENLEAMTKR